MIDLVGVLFHPYHQHINPFQIQEVFNNADASVDPDTYTAEAVKKWYQVGDWQDTLQYPALKVVGTNDGLSRQTAVKVRFQVDQFTGHMLQHCHLLFHEDQGMMAQYDMRGDEGTTWDGARDIDRTCIKPTSKKGFGPYGICTDTYPTLDLSQAYQPLNVPEQVYPDEDGVTRVQMIFGLAHYKGASFDTILRVHDAVAPGKTIHAVAGGRIELELINCLREPLGFNGPEALNKYHIPNSTK